jgi:prepilin-type N-terminal cleavage/methylation domain-containing protein
MSNTITKTSLRGFTLIELLVVIAIIGLLSTAIMGPVQTGLKKGRDTRKISDLTQVQGALLQHAGDNNGKYPRNLQTLDPTYMKTDSKMLATAPARDKFMYVIYNDLAANTVYYHLGVALENQNASLQGDADCGNATDSSGNLTGVALAANNLCGEGLTGSSTYPSFAIGGAGNPASIASTTSTSIDFGGAGTMEAASAVCSAALTTCIFDVTPN